MTIILGPVPCQPYQLKPGHAATGYPEPATPCRCHRSLPFDETCHHCGHLPPSTLALALTAILRRRESVLTAA